jgi:hypothetical protein
MERSQKRTSGEREVVLKFEVPIDQAKDQAFASVLVPDSFE